MKMEPAHVPAVILVQSEVEFDVILKGTSFIKVLKFSKTVENDRKQGLPNFSYCGIITYEGKICKLFAKLAKEIYMTVC